MSTTALASTLALLTHATPTSSPWTDLHTVRHEVDQLRYYKKGRHLCREDVHREPNITALAGDVCYCDPFCIQFGDCCVDYRSGGQPIRSQAYSCDRLGSSSRFYYTYSRCPNETLLAGCNGKVDQPSGLIHEPVFVDGILYRNEYCARCNSRGGSIESARYKWNRRVSWWPKVPRIVNADGPTTVKKLFHEHNWYYNASTRRYHLFYEQEEYTLAVDVLEFDWTNFTDVYNTSLCPPFPTISSCNESDDTRNAQLCNLYTAYAYKGSGTDITVYRNAHCALCNGVPLDELTVGLPTPPRIEERPRIIEDFLIVPDLDCPLGHVAVMGALCQPILCQVGLVWNGEQCVTEDGHAGCFLLTLDIKWVRFLDSRLVLWKSTEKVFTNYINITDGWGTVTHVRVCTKTPVTQPITPALERISELCLISSCICLTLQIVVYLALPSTRSSRPGRIIIILSTCILLGHVTFLVKDDLEPGHVTCELAAIGAHFFYISSFFWMLVMAVDSCRCLAYDLFSDRHHLMRRYVLCAFIGSFIVVFSAVFVGWFLPASDFAPAYGVEVCWFGNRTGFLIFFAFPTLLIIAANLSLFIYTAVRIRHVQGQAERQDSMRSAVSEVSRRKREIARMRVYFRLAVIVGLTWLFGIISFVAESELGHSVFTYPFLILGFVQGVFIFVAFSCKPKTIRDLRRLFCGDKKSTKFHQHANLARHQTDFSMLSEDSKRTVPLLNVETSRL